MGQDILNSQTRTNALISTGSTIGGAIPKILIYDTSDAKDVNGGRENNLASNYFDNYVTNTTKFPNNTLLYIHGTPTSSVDATLTSTAAGKWATMFGGDVIVNGTLFVNKLRKEDGGLINFSSISYVAPADDHGGGNNDISSIWNDGAPISSGEADGDLALKILANTADIATNTVSIGLKANQTDLDTLIATVTGNTSNIATNVTKTGNLTNATGLSDQIYTENESSNYLKTTDFNTATLTASLFNADKLLDSKIKENADNIGAKASQTALDTLAASSAAIDVVVASNTADIATNIAAIALNTSKTGITVEQASAIVANTDKTGITSAQASAIVANTSKTGITVEQATAIVANTDKTGITVEQASAIVANTSKTGITNAQATAIVANTDKTGITVEQATAITANTVNISALETFALNHQGEIGLNGNGFLDPYSSERFIKNKDLANNIQQHTLKQAIEALDSQAYANQLLISGNNSDIVDLQNEINATQTGAGLGDGGAYVASNNTSYLTDADSLRGADFLLDSAISALSIQQAADVVSLTSTIDNLTGGSAVVQLENIKKTVGTAAAGSHLAVYSSTNFISNDNDGLGLSDSQDTHHEAIIKLDEAIGTRSIFNIVGIDHASKDDGKILQYVAAAGGNDEKFIYVDASTGPQGPSGSDGIGISSAVDNNDGTFTLNFTDSSVFTTIDLTGPQGIQGAVGPQGIQGAVGPQGDAGAIGAAGDAGAVGADGAAGISAYQVAVNSGFVGNEADWLTSLIGAQGDQGDAGEQGTQGTQGTQGAQGTQGVAGDDGATWFSGAGDPDSGNGSVDDFYYNTSDNSVHKKGVSGWSSIATIVGDQGVKGDTGEQGIQGIQGIQGVLGADGEDADNAVIASTLAANNDFVDSVASSTSNTIGEPSDGEYDDGLFSSWTSSTTVSDAIDSFNEVLKSLAPSPAPYISGTYGSGQIANIGADTSGADGILTIDNNTVIDANTYYAVDSSSLSNPDSPFGDIAKGSAYSSITASNDKGTHRRLGVIDGATAISGKLNDSVPADGVNYPADSFGYADQGSLKLYVNDNSNPVNTILDLSVLDAIDSKSSGTGFDITAASSGSFSNGDDFTQFKYRTGTWHVGIASQRKGWNFLRVVHTIGTTDYESQYVEWFVDADTTNMSVISSSLNNLVMSTTTKKISGVEYHTSGTAQYSISVANAYKTTYSNSSVTFSGLNIDTKTVSIPAIGVDDHTKTLEFNSEVIVIAPDSLLNGTITVNASIPHPVKSNLVNEGSQSINGILLYDVTDDATLINENFKGENHRIGSDAYAAQADVIAEANEWDSDVSIASTSDLLVHDQKLMYPTQGANSGDFSGIAEGPVGNVNYSSASGTKTYYRKFQNNTTSSQQQFTLHLQGNGTILSDELTATDIKVFVKIPETDELQSTGFLNISKDFVTGEYDDNDGALSGSLSSTVSSGSTTTNTITFGQKYLKANEYFVMKIEADSDWTGYLSNIEIVWS